MDQTPQVRNMIGPEIQDQVPRVNLVEEKLEESQGQSKPRQRPGKEKVDQPDALLLHD